MTRLYYTCPIKALYMMKEFGVELGFFDYGEFFDFKHCGIYAKSVSKFLEEIDSYPNKIYIAKKSEHIFESKDWDLKNDETYEIVMRDKKHFFMPKVENE